MNTPSLSPTALVVAAVLVSMLPCLVRGDPSVVTGGQGSLEVSWRFQNPANYTLSDVDLLGGQVRLGHTQGWWNSTTMGDFLNYTNASNVDLVSRPGDVLLNSTGVALTASYTSQVGGNGTARHWTSVGWNSSSLDDLSDDFNGSSLASKWRWLNPPGSYAVGSPRPGWLTFTTGRNTDFFATQSDGQFLYQTVTGDFTVETRIQTSALTSNFQKAGLLVLYTSNTWASVQRVYATGIKVRAVTTILGSSTINATVTADVEYLRIRRLGSTLEGYYSSDGQTWNFLSNLGIGLLPGTLSVGVFGADGNSNSPVTVNVDYVHFTIPGANPRATLETRTGNATDTGDASWTPWTLKAYHNGSAVDARGRYLQYRLTLSTASPFVRPYVSDVDTAWEAYLMRGRATTEDWRPPGPMVWDLLVLSANTRGGDVQLAYSVDAGATWAAVAPGPLNITVDSSLRLRADLSTPDPSVSPTLSEIRLTLHTSSVTPPPPAPGTPFPWGLLAIVLLLALAPVPPLLYLRHPEVQDAFLVLKSGVLIAHVARGKTLEKDQDSLAATLTVIQDFVSESFTYGKGQTLHRIEMGEYNLALEMGHIALLASIYFGRGRIAIGFHMRRILRRIEAKYGKLLEPWHGDMEPLRSVEDLLRPLLGRSGSRR